MTTRQVLWVVIFASTLLRLVLAACLGADTNEAYYYAYTRHPDWSYFDHPPMVAFIVELGVTFAGWPSTVLGLRAGFLVLFAASTWLMARLTTRSFGARAGVLAAVALNASGYYGLVVGFTAQPEGPLLFFWLLTLDRLTVALTTPERLATWVGVGAAMGCALLSKYHAVLLPVGFLLYLALRPSARPLLRSPGPYLAVVVSQAFFTPVIGWNATNGWASFAFQAGRAANPLGFRPARLAEAIGGQILFLFPWMWGALVLILLDLVRRGRRAWSETEAFLFCQSAPALVLFLGVACFRHIMPYWPLIGFVSLMPLLGRAWERSLASRPHGQLRRLAAIALAPALLAGVGVLHARIGLFQDARGVTFGLVSPRSDTAVELITWDQVARELNRRGLPDTPGTFLFTDSWRRSAQLSLTTRQVERVACYDRDARGYAFWSGPKDWVGEDGIFVGIVGTSVEAEAFRPWFTRVEPLGEFPILRAGVPVLRVRLSRCIGQTRPYPFTYRGQSPDAGRHLVLWQKNAVTNSSLR